MTVTRPALLTAALSAACASCSPGGPTLHPLTGQVLYEGRPADGATVVFHPISPTPDGRLPGGVVDKDGTYTLRTYPYGAGAPEGEYMAVVTWFESPTNSRDEPPAGPAKSRVPLRYTDVGTSGLKASVKPGSNTVEPFRLTKER